MAIGEDTRGRPEYAKVEGLYGAMGFGAGGGRNFGASFRVFGLKASGDPWIDAHIRHMKATMAMQLSAGALTIVGLLVMVAGGIGGNLAAIVVFALAASLGIWSLLRTKKAATAFAKGALP